MTHIIIRCRCRRCRWPMTASKKIHQSTENLFRLDSYALMNVEMWRRYRYAIEASILLKLARKRATEKGESEVQGTAEGERPSWTVNIFIVWWFFFSLSPVHFYVNFTPFYHPTWWIIYYYYYYRVRYKLQCDREYMYTFDENKRIFQPSFLIFSYYTIRMSRYEKSVTRII